MAMTTSEVALGKRLQQARKRAGLTQQELCQRVGLSYSTLTKIERGAIRSPSVFTVATIAKITGVSVEDLLGEASGPVSSKKTSKTGVKFVYFDISGTLTNFSHKIFVDIAHDAGLPVDRVEATYWRHNDQLNRGKISVLELNHTLQKLYNLPSFDWEKYYFKNLTPLVAGRKLFDWAAQYYEVGLFSNHVFIGKMQQKGIVPSKVDVVIDSSKEGYVKPQSQIYKIAQKRAGLPANSILLVDNERPNLITADQLDWQTAWFDDYHPAESAERIKKLLDF